MYRVEDYPQIKNNFYLDGRNTGACKKLKGNIATLTVFMHNRNSKWTEEDKKKYFNSLNTATKWLVRQAKRYKVNLSFKNYSFDVTVNDDINTHNDFNLIKDFLRVETMQQAHDYYTKSLNCDECPFILVYNMQGRSFGRRHNDNFEGIINECSTVFIEKNKEFDWRVITHELLHQYGAVDYYFPKKIEETANKYLGISIMDRNLSQNVDDFTAYIIGWKETISGNTYWFLKETMWLTYDKYNEELNNEWKKKYN